MSELLLKGGRVIDKSGERLADVLIDPEGRIAEVGEGLKGRETLDVRGKVISSGFVDLNACLLYTSPSPRDKRQSRMPSSA